MPMLSARLFCREVSNRNKPTRNGVLPRMLGGSIPSTDEVFMSKWNLRNTLVALSYYNGIKAVYDGMDGIVQKGAYGCDNVGMSRYIPEKTERVLFTTHSNACFSSVSVSPEKIKLKVNNQLIDLSSFKDDPDAYFRVHELIELAKKQNVNSAVAIAS